MLPTIWLPMMLSIIPPLLDRLILTSNFVILHGQSTQLSIMLCNTLRMLWSLLLQHSHSPLLSGPSALWLHSSDFHHLTALSELHLMEFSYSQVPPNTGLTPSSPRLTVPRLPCTQYNLMCASAHLRHSIPTDITCSLHVSMTSPWEQLLNHALKTLNAVMMLESILLPTYHSNLEP